MDFFETILPGDVPDGLALCLWKQPRSHWAQSTNEARAICQRLESDVFVGCAFGDLHQPPTQRVRKDTARGLFGLWADFDIAGPGHQAKAYPPNEAAVGQVIGELPLAPTMVTWTGGGMHAWWLFEEPWIFDGAEDRKVAGLLARGWEQLIQRQAGRHGWAVDSVADLARIMRVPGPPNTKTGERRETRIVSADGGRFNPSDFEEWAAADVDPFNDDGGESEFSLGGIEPYDVIRADDRVRQARNHFPEFSATLGMDRRDLGADASAYDLSIMSWGAQFGWPDQFIVDLCRSFRAAKFPDTIKKAQRRDYYERTLRRARRVAVAREAERELPLLLDDVAREPEKTNDHKGEVLSKVNALLGGVVTVEAVTRYVADPRCSFEIRTSAGVVRGLSIEDITTARRFAAAIADTTKQIPVVKKGDRWADIAQAILLVADDVVIEEQMADVAISALVDAYVATYSKVPSEDDGMPFALAMKTGAPVRVEGTVHVTAPQLAAWFNQQRVGLHHTPKSIAVALKSAGWESVRIHRTLPGVNSGQIRARLWRRGEDG